MICLLPGSTLSRAARKLRALRSSRLKLLTRCSVGSRGPCNIHVLRVNVVEHRDETSFQSFFYIILSDDTLLSKGESEARGILVGDVGQLWMADPLSKLFSRVQVDWTLATDKEEDLGGECNCKLFPRKISCFRIYMTSDCKGEHLEIETLDLVDASSTSSTRSFSSSPSTATLPPPVLSLSETIRIRVSES